MIIEIVGIEIEKIKGDFESYLNGLNMVGAISYSLYSKLYDEGTKQIQRAYELGKSDLEKKNAELKRKLSKIQKMFEPQDFTDLMDEVEKEYADEQKINELEKEDSRLNQIILGNEEEITDLRKDCEEYSKTFNRQNDEIVSLRKKMIKTKEIIRSLYFIIQGRIDYKGNIPLEDEMYRAKQFLEKEL